MTRSLCLIRYTFFYLLLFLINFSNANAAFDASDFLKANGRVLRNQSGAGAVVNLRGTNLGSWLLRENWMAPAGAKDEFTLREILTARFQSPTMESLLQTFEDFWLQASDLDNIKNMGMNVVRTPIYWEDFMNRDGTLKPDSIAFGKLDWLVTEANKRNIYVIIDLHGTPGAACPWQSCGKENSNQLWTNPTYQTWTVQIWQRIATHYKGNPAIAAYDLLNEPVVTMGDAENPTQVKQKMDFYNRLYQAVRPIDPDHTIIIAAFYDWWAALPPATYGWENVMYQTHHYNFANYDDWESTNREVNRWLADIATYQRNWNIPAFAGEFSMGQMDLYEKWLRGLNALNASWTSWSYKVVGGGTWGYYINNRNPYPNLQSDSADTIIAKWSKFTTENFVPHTAFINLVKKYTSSTPIESKWSSFRAVANGLYVAAENAGAAPLVANRAIVNDWERFQIIKNSDGTVSLSAMINNKYVHVDLNNQGRLIANATTIGNGEKFSLIDMGNGEYSLKSLANNRYVCADLYLGAVLHANRDVALGWEKFTISDA